MTNEEKVKQVQDRAIKKELSKFFYPELFDFLSKNELEIRSHFRGTDLYCAYAIYNKVGECILPFLYNTFDNVEFDLSGTLSESTTISISECDFISKIKAGHKLSEAEKIESIISCPPVLTEKQQKELEENGITYL